MPALRSGTPNRHIDHSRLARDQTVRPWLDEIGLRSKVSVSVSLRRLGLFLHETHLSTEKLIDLANDNPERLRDLLIEYAKDAKARKRLGSYVKRILTVVKSYLRFRGSTFDQFPKVGVTDGESLVNERTPTPDELRLLLTALNARGRVVALLMAHAGLRPGVIADVNGEDGLTIGDLPELRVEDGRVEFEKTPFVIVVPARLSKVRKSYVTFGSSELAEAIQVYLRERLARGQSLAKESALVASTGQGRGPAGRFGEHLKPGGRFVSTKAITFDLRDAIRKVRPGGQTFRPYALRAFCSTQLLIAESRGLIVRDAREHFLGHDLGPAGRYHLGKKLRPDLVEELRSMYDRASEFLLTAPKPRKEEAKTLVRAEILKYLGYSDGEAERLATDPTVDVRKLLSEKLAPPKAADVKPPLPGDRAKTVALTELDAFLAAGWKPIGPAGSERFVIGAPN